MSIRNYSRNDASNMLLKVVRNKNLFLFSSTLHRVTTVFILDELRYIRKGYHSEMLFAIKIALRLNFVYNSR